MEEKIVYFEHSGKDNTDETLKLGFGTGQGARDQKSDPGFYLGRYRQNRGRTLGWHGHQVNRRAPSVWFYVRTQTAFSRRIGA